MKYIPPLVYIRSMYYCFGQLYQKYSLNARPSSLEGFLFSHRMLMIMKEFQGKNRRRNQRQRQHHHHHHHLQREETGALLLPPPPTDGGGGGGSLEVGDRIESSTTIQDGSRHPNCESSSRVVHLVSSSHHNCCGKSAWRNRHRTLCCMSVLMGMSLVLSFTALRTDRRLTNLFSSLSSIPELSSSLSLSPSLTRPARQTTSSSDIWTEASGHFASPAVRAYFAKLLEFYGGLDKLPPTYVEQIRRGGWQQPKQTLRKTNKNKTKSASTLTFVFVAGPEGSGHHTIEEIAGVIQRYYNNDNASTSSIAVELEPSLMSEVYFENPRENGGDYTTLDVQTIESRLDRVRPLRRLFRKTMYENSTTHPPVQPTRHILFDSQDAYPYGASRLLRYVDLTHLQTLRDNGYFAKLKVILLSRDPTNATLSNNRRGFHRNADIERQARIMENAMTYLSAAAYTLTWDNVLLWPFEFFVQEPSIMLGALASFLDISETVFSESSAGQAIADVARHPGNKNVSFSPLQAQAHKYTRDYVKARTCMHRLLPKDQTTAKCETLVRGHLDAFFQRRNAQWPMIRPLQVAKGATT